MSDKATRSEKVASIVRHLESFRADPRFASSHYAIDKNVQFLGEAVSPLRFARWYFTQANRLDGGKLLELTDFPYEPWDEEMHSELMALERKENPGILKPLVDAITERLLNLKRDAVVASLGAGGMEVDRQVIEALKKAGYSRQLTILAVDLFESTHDLASKNLSEIQNVSIRRYANVEYDAVMDAQANPSAQFQVLLFADDVFSIEALPEKIFDVAYHSLFKHHLSSIDRERLDRLMRRSSRNGLEYDGYRNWPVGAIQAAFAWHSLVFLNGTVFSMARYNTKQQIAAHYSAVSFFPKTAHYLRRI